MTTILRRALLATTLVAAPLVAQHPSAPGRDSGGAALEARVRQRLATVVQKRLELTDDQMRRLTAVNAGYETRRRDLLARERQSRVAIRTELRRGKAADQKRVETALNDLFRAQRERIDIAEQEQRELAAFMQPAQRAGYLALQEQMRRRIEEMRERRERARANGDGPAKRPR